MKDRLRRILLPIHDLHRPPRAALRKGAALARASGAGIELFHALTEPLTAGGRRGSSLGGPDAALHQAQRRLGRIARSAPLRGCRVTSLVVWDSPVYEAIIRRARTWRADLVVAATHPHTLAERWFLRFIDWELLRHCPCPLLLVKSSRPYRRPVVLVAVDPFHTHAKPARLDPQLLAAGARLAKLLSGSVHAFHAYAPLVANIAGSLGEPLVWESPEVEKVHGEQVRTEFNRLAAKAHIPSSRRHLVLGDIPTELAFAVQRLKAQVVVMGAVSRSRLRRLVVGNTAERVLDQLSSDALIVKPRGFKTTVPLTVRDPRGPGGGVRRPSLRKIPSD